MAKRLLSPPATNACDRNRTAGHQAARNIAQCFACDYSEFSVNKELVVRRMPRKGQGEINDRVSSRNLSPYSKGDETLLLRKVQADAEKRLPCDQSPMLLHAASNSPSCKRISVPEHAAAAPTIPTAYESG